MYKNIIHDRDTNILHIWDEDRGYIKEINKKYCYILDPNGKYTTINGEKVTKIYDWDYTDESVKSMLYESDISPDLRYLVDNYSKLDTPPKNLNIGIMDMEVSSKGGFPQYIDPVQEITAMSFYYKNLDRYWCFILDENGRVDYNKIDNKEIIPCRSESELVDKFLTLYEKADLDIITGWNTDRFDIPYFGNRVLKICGNRMLNRMSKVGIVKWSKMQNSYHLYGVSKLDYMKLYKTYTYNDQPSYSLDFICNEEIGRGKIKFDGSLNDLFENDIHKFIDYNINDVDLIAELDRKKDLINLAVGIAHKGHVAYEDVFMSSKVVDGAILSYAKNHDIVLPNKKKDNDFMLLRDHDKGEEVICLTENISPITSKTGTLRIWRKKTATVDVEYIDYQDNFFILKEPLPLKILDAYPIGLHFEGAYVKDPIPGLYDWLYDLDLTSMYPSNIMSLNISMETKRGKILLYSEDEFHSEVDRIYRVYFYDKQEEIKMSYNEIDEFLKLNKYSLASNGVFYDTKIKGIIPIILEIWFGERKEYSGLAEKYGNEKNDDLYKYYDLRQLVMKVLLNTVYGVLGLESFRFYDLDNADAVTSTGRNLISFSNKIANKYYSRELNEEKDYIIYNDTDAIFCSALPLLLHRYPDIDQTNEDLMIEKVLEITNEIQSIINKSYDLYAKRFHYTDTHKWNIKQEIIATSGFWLAKKRYALKIKYKKGVKVDKLEVKGIDVVRSNFPKKFRAFTKGILIDILNKHNTSQINSKIFELRDSMKEFDALDIMFPTGIKNISDFENDVPFQYHKGTPAHVKASLIYNDLLKYYKYTNLKPIQDSDKIKWTYLKKNSFNINTIALTGDNDPIELINLVNEYIDMDTNYDKILKGKLQDFYNALNWGLIPDSELIGEYFDF